jgi:hypothetical protein
MNSGKAKSPIQRRKGFCVIKRKKDTVTSPRQQGIVDLKTFNLIQHKTPLQLG